MQEALCFVAKSDGMKRGEQHSKYFYNLEKANFNAKTCKLLIKDDGSSVETPSEISCEQVKFYTELYRSDPDVCFNIVNDTNIFLHNTQIEHLNRPISQEEVKDALFNMPSNKSPGPDGIPAEIYKLLWNEIGEVLCEAYQEAYTSNKLFPSALSGS